MIALTFDDGPGPSTSRILDTLRAYGVHATFFVIGRNLAEAPWASESSALGTGQSIVRRAMADGHTIGNHTYSHSRQTFTEPEFLREIETTDALIKGVAEGGRIATRLPPIRLPYGVVSGDVRLEYIGAMGRPHVHWSKDFNDWHEGPIEGLATRIVDYIESREATGLDSVVDLHDGGIGGETGYGRSATAEAVLRVVAEAERRRWSFFRAPLNA